MIWVIAFILLAAALSGICLAPVMMSRERWHVVAVSFATGTLVAVVMGDVIPHVMAQSHSAGAALALGYLGMMVLNRYVFQTDPCCSVSQGKDLGFASVGAMALCALNDGFILGGADIHLHSPLLWVMVAHKFTAAFGLYVMVQGCVTHRRPSGIAFLILYLLVTPVVYVLTKHQLHIIGEWLPMTMATSSGVLLYVVSSNMIPRCNDLGKDWPRLVVSCLLAGCLVTLLFLDHHGVEEWDHSSEQGAEGHHGHHHGHEH